MEKIECHCLRFDNERCGLKKSYKRPWLLESTIGAVLLSSENRDALGSFSYTASTDRRRRLRAVDFAPVLPDVMLCLKVVLGKNELVNRSLT